MEEDKQYLFITGFRRSGTSIMKAIMGCHPQIHMIPKEVKTSELPIDESGIDKPIVGLKRNMYIRYIDEIKEIYPNSKFIYMIRDSRACVASQKTYDLNNSRHFNNDSALGLCQKWTKDLWDYYHAEAIYGNDIIKIRYEDFVMNPIETLKKICGFIGIGFDKVMLNFKDEWKHGLLDGYTSYSDTIDDGRIYTSSIDKWKYVLTKNELVLVELTNLGSLMYEGYEVDFRKWIFR